MSHRKPLPSTTSRASQAPSARIVLSTVLALCLSFLPACSDHAPGLEVRVQRIPVVRTEGPRDITEPWAKLEERPQPNGDMWTLWGLSHPDKYELRWEHRAGLRTRFVPRDEAVPE